MSTATAIPEQVNERLPGPHPRSTRPRAPWMMLPALALPLAAAVAWRRMRRRAGAVRPAAVWRLASGNNVRFSPHVDFHPTVKLGRRRR